MAKFVACRSFRNVPKLNIQFDPKIQLDYDAKTGKTAVGDWGDKTKPTFKHIPAGARFTIGTAEVLAELTQEEKEKVLELSVRTPGEGGTDQPMALPILPPQTDKMVASIDRKAAKRAKILAEQEAASKNQPNINELLATILGQQAEILARTSPDKGGK